MTPPATVMQNAGLIPAKLEAEVPGSWSSLESQMGVVYANSDHMAITQRFPYLTTEIQRLLNEGLAIQQKYDAHQLANVAKKNKWLIVGAVLLLLFILWWWVL